MVTWQIISDRRYRPRHCNISAAGQCKVLRTDASTNATNATSSDGSESTVSQQKSTLRSAIGKHLGKTMRDTVYSDAAT